MLCVFCGILYSSSVICSYHSILLVLKRCSCFSCFLQSWIILVFLQVVYPSSSSCHFPPIYHAAIHHAVSHVPCDLARAYLRARIQPQAENACSACIFQWRTYAITRLDLCDVVGNVAPSAGVWTNLPYHSVIRITLCHSQPWGPVRITPLNGCSLWNWLSVWKYPDFVGQTAEKKHDKI